MSKKAILLTGVAALLLVGGSLGVFVVPSENFSGWQIAQMATPPGQQQEKRSTPAPTPSGAPSAAAPSAAQQVETDSRTRLGPELQERSRGQGS